MKKTLFISLFICLAFTALLLQSCRKEDEFTSDSGAKLDFSADTVMFDTVFTQIGTHTPMSITKQLWIINNNDKGVKTNIHLKGTPYGTYKLNIDGKPGDVAYGKEIRGHDSIVIFVQIYLDPNNTNLPFVVTDQVIFETNGNVQDVDLVGWGQDANYFNHEVLDCGSGNLHWTKDKPYVIYDSVLVPKGCTLTIDAGTKIYSHIKSVLLIAGTLIVNGTPDNPVLFGGDRLDPDYRDIPGQWVGIRLLAGSQDNVITGAVIKNGLVGVEVDSASVTNNPNLTISQSIIQNMSTVGLLGYSASITAINNAIINCGQFNFYGALGGDYILVYNTMAAYGGNFSHQNAQFVLDNSPYTNSDGQIIHKFPLNFELTNNIIFGTQEDELILNNNPDGEQSSTFRVIQKNLLRTTLNVNTNNTNILNKDPLFEDVINYKVNVLEGSPAIGAAMPITEITTDLKNKTRSVTTPTMGAYEYQ